MEFTNGYKLHIILDNTKINKEENEEKNIRFK